VQRRRQVLLIEDNAADVFIIRKAIAAAEPDADLQVVYDGEAATQLLDDLDADENAACPDIVLLDLNLPKKNGDDVLKHLRASKRCANALVLIVSSSDVPRDQSAVASLGIAGYFKKPFELAEFMELGPLVKALLEDRKPAAKGMSS